MADYHDDRQGTDNLALAVRCSPKSISAYHGLVRELLGSLSSKETAPVVGITSASHGSGVTTIAAKLGVTAAEIVTRPALLIDCNANAPDLVNLFDAPVTCGINEVITGERLLGDCVFPTRINNLLLLGPGTAPFERANADETQGWNDLLRNSSSHLGIVILDLPPVPELLSEVSSLQGIDRLLLVVEAERTRRQAVARAISQLERVGVELSGIVLNKRRNHIPGWIYRKI